MRRFLERIVLITAVFSALLIISGLLRSTDIARIKYIADFHKGWTYSDIFGNEHNINSLPEKIKWKKGNTLVIKNLLPDISTEGESVIFQTHYQSVKVYVDNSLRYSYDVEKGNVLEMPGCMWNYVGLDMADSGKPIRIELTSDYRESTGEICPIYIGDAGEHMVTVLRRKSVALYLCNICLAIGVGLLFIHLYLKKKNKQSYGFGYLGLFTILVTIWGWCEARCTFLILDSTELGVLILCTGIMLAPAAGMVFMRNAIATKRISRCLLGLMAMISVVNYIVQMYLQFSGRIICLELMTLDLIIVGLALILVAVVAIYEIRSKGSEDAKAVLAAELVLIVFAAIDVVRYYENATVDAASFTRFGLLYFLIIIIFHYGNKMYKLSAKGKEAAVYERLAYEDELTRCKNRAYFQKELGNVWENSSLYDHIAIVVFDLNYLKYNNDNFGHQVGDRLLKVCATAITEAFISRGVCCRIGGDEFGIIVKEQSEESIKNCLKLLDERIDFYNKNSLYKVSVAYGYAMYDSRDRDLEDSLIRADKEMYKHKMEIKKKGGYVTDGGVQDIR